MTATRQPLATTLVVGVPWSPRQVATLRLFAVGLTLLGWALQFGWTTQPVFSLDDAYITLTNVASFSSGESRYAASPLIGATSLVHFALVWALAPVAGVTWGVALSCAVGALAYALGLVALARALGVTPLRAALVAFVGTVVGLSQFQSYTGLETGLAMAAVTWALVCMVRQNRLALAVVCGLMPWVRPDLVPLSVLCLLLQGRDARGRWWQPVLLGAGIALLVSLPCGWFLYAQTGQLVPSTALAKRYFFAESCLPLRPRLHLARTSIQAFLWQTTLLAGALLLSRRNRLTVACLGFLAIFLAAYVQNLPGGLNHNYNRYLYPTMPLLVALLASGLVARSARRRALASVLLVGLTGIGLLRDLAVSERLGADRRAFTIGTMAPLADWIRGHTPPGALLLVHDAGYMAYRADRRLEDMVGLKSPDAIPTHRETTFASCGMQRSSAIAQIVARDRPGYLVVLHEWDAIFRLTAGFPNAEARLKMVYDQPLGYSVYEVDYTTAH